MGFSVKWIDIGFLEEDDQYVIFFGGVGASLENLRAKFPNYQFARIKQTHSSIVVPAEVGRDPLVEADAHFTSQKNLALLISTADCTPVMVAADNGVIASIHAGWRGVASRIVPKTMGAMGAKRYRAWVGPHIQKNSFEVDEDVALNLIKSAPGISAKVLPGKNFVDLDLLVRSQLAEHAIQSLWTSGVDTKTDLRFHSHRRDREKAGRQLSFILRK